MTEQIALDAIRDRVPIDRGETLEAKLCNDEVCSVIHLEHGEEIDEYLVQADKIDLVPSLELEEQEVVDEFWPEWKAILLDTAARGETEVTLVQADEECELFLPRRATGLEEYLESWIGEKWYAIECEMLRIGFRAELVEGRLFCTKFA